MVIVLFSVDNNTSLVVPFNASDASQRGWLNSEPRKLHITRGHQICKTPLSIIQARMMGGQLLYDRPWFDYNSMVQIQQANLALEGAETVCKQFSVAIDIIIRHKERIEQRRLEQVEKNRRNTVEGRLKDDLEYVGASLLNWSEIGDGHEVTYEYNGAQFTMTVGENNRIESAGICLNDTDRDHNLSSIVLAMENARKLRRFDLHERYYI